MAKYTFICEQEDFIDEYDKSKIIFEFHANNIHKILPKFEAFVRASGFSYIKGDLDFVQHEDRQEPENSQYLFSTDAEVSVDDGSYQQEFSFSKECSLCGKKKDRYCIDSRCPKDSW